MARRGTVPCEEFIDLGPFRFECSGHYDGEHQAVRMTKGGVLAHHALSPGDVGDVDVTFWTQLDG